ncbi:MAG: LacI family transcriptional regulator [Firmicutes bacterium]|nr:LacI family transcriptional regulator [Bacillota bacterium]
MGPTIKDIAKEVGVSHSTVSRALNGDPRISAATRQKVLEAAERLGYQPNLSGRGLAHGKVFSIGLVIPDILEPFFARVVNGVSQVAYRAGFNLILYLTHADRRMEMAALQQIGHGRVDGMIIMARKVGRQSVLALRRHKVPIVLLIETMPEAGFDGVRVNNEGGAMQAVNHLLGLGHKRIACITGPRHASDARERLRGYRQAIRAAGVDPDAEGLIFKGNFTEQSGAEAVDRMIQLPPDRRPTAIVAMNDATALGAMNRLARHGIVVPDEMAVVGFDDMPFARFVHPGLTTVRQPIEELGKAAADLLIARIRGEVKEYREVVLNTQLIVRESCGSGRARSHPSEKEC